MRGATKRPQLNLSLPPRFTTACAKKPLTQTQFEATEIVDNLFLGGWGDAQSLVELERNNIRCILNLADDCDSVSFPGIDVRKFGMRDHSDENISSVFSACLTFIESALQTNKGILVHCRLGISRSATVVIAYLMTHGDGSTCQRMSYDRAFDYVKKLRPEINPNLGFTLALHELHIRLVEDVGCELVTSPKTEQSYFVGQYPRIISDITASTFKSVSTLFEIRHDDCCALHQFVSFERPSLPFHRMTIANHVAGDGSFCPRPRVHCDNLQIATGVLHAVCSHCVHVASIVHQQIKTKIHRCGQEVLLVVEVYPCDDGRVMVLPSDIAIFFSEFDEHPCSTLPSPPTNQETIVADSGVMFLDFNDVAEAFASNPPENGIISILTPRILARGSIHTCLNVDADVHVVRMEREMSVRSDCNRLQIVVNKRVQHEQVPPAAALLKRAIAVTCPSGTKEDLIGTAMRDLRFLLRMSCNSLPLAEKNDVLAPEFAREVVALATENRHTRQ